MYDFFVRDLEVRETLGEVLERGNCSTERMLEIVYQPQAKFRVQSVTHCTSSIPGVCVCACVRVCVCVSE